MLVLDGDLDGVLALVRAAQQLFAQVVFDQVFDRAPQRPGAEIGVEPLVDQELLGLVVDQQLQVLLVETRPNLGQLQVDDLAHVLAGQAAEHDRVVQPVQELGAKVPLDFLHQALFHRLVVGLLAPLAETHTRLVHDDLGPQVAGQNQDRVAEVDLAAERIRQPTFFHDLQQHVVDVAVGLLDLVHEDHRVGPAADALGQLAALLVADVSRRGADQAAHVVLLHVLAHVHLDQGVLAAEHELGQGLRQFGLADAGRADEQEAAHGPPRIFQAAATATQALGDGPDGLVLADDALVQLVLHPQQPFGLLALQPRQGHAGHLRDHLRHHLGVDHAVDLLGRVAPLAQHLVLAGLQVVDLVPQLGGTLVGAAGHRLFLLAVEPIDLALDLGDVRRPGHGLQVDPGAGLVDHVDGLVRQTASGDVAVRQFHGGMQGVVGNLHAMVSFVAVSQAAQNFDRLVTGGRLDDDRLEAPFQGPVLLDVLAVLVQRGGPDALDFAAAQGGLQDVGGVDGSLGPAGPDQGVQLVDEEDDVLGPPHFVHDGLDPLLELPAVLCPGHHQGQVQNDDAPLAKQFRHAAVDY